MRIGDAEREAAIEALGGHLASGRIDIDEYTERTGTAAAARTRADLDALFTDLPGPHQPPPLPPAPPPPMAPPAAPYVPTSAQAPYGIDAYGRPLSSKNRWVAGVLQVVFPFGVGRFYTGQPGIGVAQLVLCLLFGIGAIWCLVDGVLLLVNGGTDGSGRQLQS